MIRSNDLKIDYHTIIPNDLMKSLVDHLSTSKSTSCKVTNYLHGPKDKRCCHYGFHFEAPVVSHACEREFLVESLLCNKPCNAHKTC